MLVPNAEYAIDDVCSPYLSDATGSIKRITLVFRTDSEGNVWIKPSPGRKSKREEPQTAKSFANHPRLRRIR